jgi:transposase
MCNDIRYYDDKRKKLHQIIINEVIKSEEGRKLLTLCGIRAISAFTVMATVGDINRFKNPKKLVAYFGFSPKCHESGNLSRNSGISRNGRKDAKSVLIQSAQAVLRSGNKSAEKLRKWGFSLTHLCTFYTFKKSWENILSSNIFKIRNYSCVSI